MHIMVPDSISTTSSINPSHQSLCTAVYPHLVSKQRLGKNPLLVARQKLGRNVTAATNTQKTIQELLDASFSIPVCVV
jgi:hypothetical protein